MNNSEILIYQNSEGNIKIDVRLEEESVWLNQSQMAGITILIQLYQWSKYLFSTLPMYFNNGPPKLLLQLPKIKNNSFRRIPKEFCRKDYLTVAHKLGIPDKTAEKHIKRFAVNGLVNHYAHDKYKKP